MTTQDERKAILEMVQSGTITAEEAARLLKILEETHEEERDSQAIDEPLREQNLNSYIPPSTGVDPSQNFETSLGESGDRNQIPAYWRRWWMIPLWVGVGITVLGAGLMYWALQATGTSFWFACAWLPFLFGLAIMLLAWSTRPSRWLHIRVFEQKGRKTERLAISFPIPIRPTAWFLKNFGRYIPNSNETGIDEIILALEENTSPDMPFYIEVDEGENEHVQIYIG